MRLLDDFVIIIAGVVIIVIVIIMVLRCGGEIAASRHSPQVDR